MCVVLVCVWRSPGTDELGLGPGAEASSEDRCAAGARAVGPGQAGRQQATGFNLSVNVPFASE